MDIGYIERATTKKWLSEGEEISRMLHALIKSIKERSRSKGQGESGKMQDAKAKTQGERNLES